MCAATDDGVVSFVMACSKLKVLRIPGSPITDESINAVSKHLPDLALLDVSRCGFLTRSSLSELATLRSLRTLSVYGLHNAVLVPARTGREALEDIASEDVGTMRRIEWSALHTAEFAALSKRSVAIHYAPRPATTIFPHWVPPAGSPAADGGEEVARDAGCACSLVECGFGCKKIIPQCREAVRALHYRVYLLINYAGSPCSLP